MGALKWPSRGPPKDPQEVLDYGFDWRPRQLGVDVIVTTTAQLYTTGGDDGVLVTDPPDGWLVIESHAVGEVEGVPAGQATVTWLSGGTSGETYFVNLHASTASGRELEQRMSIKVKER